MKGGNCFFYKYFRLIAEIDLSIFFDCIIFVMFVY